MLQRIAGLALVAVLVVAMTVSAPGPVQAQGDPGGAPDGVTDYDLNMRAGPGTDYAVLTVLPSNTGLYFEGRSEDRTWLLGQTADGSIRGWVASLYLSYRDGFLAVNLPISDEVVAAPPPAPDAVPNAPVVSDPGGGALASLPVVPSIGPRVGAIVQVGQAWGNNPHVFTLVGGCNSLAQGFMMPFGTGNYNLGPYAHLQATIDHFSQVPVDGWPNAFMHKGVAVQAGYTAAAVLDPAWSNPATCAGGVSPLVCEYDRSHPGVALIMLGILDVYWYSPAEFEGYMRQIVEISIERGVIPVLTTFPTTTPIGADQYSGAVDYDLRAQYRAAFNTVIVQLAQEYGVPLMNFWRASQAVPRSGFRPDDFIHLYEPATPGAWANLNNPASHSVFAVWNLAALQTLDALRAAALGG